MVGRVKPNNGEELVITLTDARGVVLHQESCDNGEAACRRACIVLAGRGELRAGDLLRVTVPPVGEVHQPRETD